VRRHYHGADEVLGAFADGGPVRIGEVIEAAFGIASLLYFLKRFCVVWSAVGALYTLIGRETTKQHEKNDAARPYISALVVRLHFVTFLTGGRQQVCST
jgi:hypothetical protein